MSNSIVFIHGSGCSSAVWAEQLERFSAEYHTVALDLPGHGQNPRSSCSSISELVECTWAEMLQLGLRRPVIVGHSLGGAVALQLALDHQEELGGLVLIGTGARLRIPPSLFEQVRNDYHATLAQMPSILFCTQTPGLVVDAVMAVHRKTSAEVFLSDLTACDRFDVTGRLREIQLPSLIITGHEDLAVPPKYSTYLHQNLPRSTLAIIEDAGHMVIVEQAGSINLEIERFLAGLNLASS